MDKIEEEQNLRGLDIKFNEQPTGVDKCEKCDSLGGELNYKNQVLMPIDGKVRCIDWCIHPIVAALNAAGIATVACCCGHGEQPGRIDLADGRVLFIKGG